MSLREAAIAARNAKLSLTTAPISHQLAPSLVHYFVMTYPRAHLVNDAESGFYHCVSRCVRRAFLCGADRQTGRSFEHRRGWIEQRIRRLGKIFAIDIVAYAVMSNHYHLVVRTHPEGAANWGPLEVATRWLALSKSADQTAELARLLARDALRIAVLRRRLGSLSWFMRYLNEPIARRANAEDECTGRFWEGRFKSVALLDRAAVLNCIAYVDLNPVRAKEVSTVVEAPFTTIQSRYSGRDDGLFELSELGLGLADYVNLLTWTVASGKDCAVEAQPNVLESLNFGQTPSQWCEGVFAQRHYYRAYGLLDALQHYVKSLGQVRLRCAVTFPQPSIGSDPPAL